MGRRLAWPIAFTLTLSFFLPLLSSASDGLEFWDGKLKLWGSGQAVYRWTQSDPARDLDGVSQGLGRRAQLGLEASPVEWLDFGLAGEVNNFDPPVMNGDTLRADLYEAWVEVKLPWSLSIKAGHWIPPWTLTMPLRAHEMDFIRYPLMVDCGQLLATPWQQTGAMFTARPGSNFFIGIGAFSGIDRPGEILDDNNMFDTMAVVSLGLFPGFRLSLGHWGGKTELASERLSPGESVDLPFGLSAKNYSLINVDAGGGVVEHRNTWVAADFEYGHWRVFAESIWNQADQDGAYLRDMWGYHFSVVYKRDWLHAMARYEQMDPDTNDLYGGMDEMEWTTLGLSVTPYQWLKISGAYIFKTERGDNQVANDELLFQVTLGQ